MERGKLHIISTGKQHPDHFAEIIGSIHPYADAIHLREKRKTASELYGLVERLAAKQVPLSKIFINDRADVAWATQVTGVQLAYHSLPAASVKKYFPGLKIGCSVHSPDEALAAQEQGADHLIFGHVFPTRSKPGLPAKGLEQVQTIAELVDIPLVAIGGIKPGDVEMVRKAGAEGIAVKSGVLEANNPLEAVKEYHRSLSIV